MIGVCRDFQKNDARQGGFAPDHLTRHQGEVLIALETAGAGPRDLEIRGDEIPPRKLHFPLMLGVDGAGVRRFHRALAAVIADFRIVALTTERRCSVHFNASIDAKNDGRHG
ncbi:MAG: hypothetical protein ACXWJ8_02650 [Xanthobacteraceae bacterium]